jgi:hypothetical protein
VGVTFYEETLDVSCTAVTPPCSKGALGTWRSQCGARTPCREHAALEARTSLWVNQRLGGVHVCQCLSLAASGKAHEGKPRSEPDWVKPTVRDRRGACGNVVAIGSRTEGHRETDGNATGPYGCRRAAFLSRPSSSRREIGGSWVGRITGATGKSADDERVEDGSVVAMKRSNVRGARGPCCL